MKIKRTALSILAFFIWCVGEWLILKLFAHATPEDIGTFFSLALGWTVVLVVTLQRLNTPRKCEVKPVRFDGKVEAWQLIAAMAADKERRKNHEKKTAPANFRPSFR